MNIIKLNARRVVVSEAGVTKVINLPCGVSYSEDHQRFYAWVIDPQTDSWKGKSWGAKKHGAIEAFENAVEAREESLSYLLTRRLLPRIRRPYEIREISGLFYVRDPLAKKYRMFSTLAQAAKFNIDITKEWIGEYTFDKLTMIQIERSGYGVKAVLAKYDHRHETRH
jgi:hypothetical protein